MRSPPRAAARGRAVRDPPGPSRRRGAVSGVERLIGIALNTFDARKLARFYVDTLGFTRVGGDDGVALRLGGVRVDLVEVGGDARPYPRRVAGWSPLFQHFAIVVRDMPRAMAALDRSDAWSPISRDGPERLPASSGGVTAFKFRDPQGHPLEFLMFADASAEPDANPFVRIDHSALSVVDVKRSIAFYRGLGLRVTSRSLNAGIEQQRMDDIDDATVDVIGLALPLHETPHVELLGYRGDHDRVVGPMATDDIAATRLILGVAGDAALGRIVDAYGQHLVATTAATVTLRDPDHHLLTFVTMLDV